MRILATDSARADFDGEHMIVTIPSGRDNLEIALPIHIALRMCRLVQRKAENAVMKANGQAEVISLAKHHKRAGRR